MTDSSAHRTSRSLIAAVRENDGAAWDRLVDLYAPFVLHWCRHQGLPEHDAADILQEVFQAVAGHIHSFRKERATDTFRGWLRTITRNKIYDHFRRTKHQVRAAGGTAIQTRMAQVPSPSPPLAPDTSEADPVRDAADTILVHRALEMIRPHFREHTWRAFWRTVVDGQPPNEVADELSMSPGAVRVAKSRVLQRLREELGDLYD